MLCFVCPNSKILHIEAKGNTSFGPPKTRGKQREILLISAENIPVCATISLPDGIHKPLIGVVIVVSVGP